MNSIFRTLGTAALVSTISLVSGFSNVSPAVGLQTAPVSVEADEEPGKVVTPNFNDSDGDKITAGEANSLIKQSGGNEDPPPQCPPPYFVCFNSGESELLPSSESASSQDLLAAIQHNSVAGFSANTSSR